MADVTVPETIFLLEYSEKLKVDCKIKLSATFCRLITITPFYIYIAAKIITQIFAPSSQWNCPKR